MYNSNTMQQKTIHLARATMTLLLVMFTSLGAWATGGTLAGTGTSSDPYVIVDADDWATFVNWINNSNSTYGNKCYKLGDNITISSMAGTSNYKFKGTFDGDGHTITLNNLTSTGEFCAPFRYVDGATFKRIHTTGTVKAGSHTSNDKYRTGLVGDCRGTTTITNCWSSVTITSEINEDGTHGGFVGVVNGGTLTITNCLFDGSITGANTWANAGFVGWTGGYTTNITNCLMLGTMNDNSKNGATFMRGNSDNTASNIKVNNSYYNTAHGTVQGTAIGSKENSDLLTALGDGWEISGGKLVPIMSAKNLTLATISGLASPYYYWTGSPIVVNYTVKDANNNTLTQGTDYTATISPSTVQEVGEYTLTITGKGTYTGTKVVSFEVRRVLSGSGTATDPYLIGSVTDWETFVGWINNENSTYRSKYYKLTADINVTSTVGTSDNNSFRGTFDGDGHTITLNLTSDGDYCAPFRYCRSNATFKRIHIAGTINTSHKYAAGLVGSQNNSTLNITNCWSSVTINSSTNNSDTSHGGFVGYAYGNTYITNCRFDGKLLGSDSKGCGGFVGNRSGYFLYITNSLFAPTELSFGTSSSYTFAHPGGASITNCYYTSTLGTAEGTAVGAMTNAELQQALGNGWEIKNNQVVPIQDIKNLTAGTLTCNTFIPYTGSEITLTPTIKDMDGNTVAAENYSISYSPNPVKALGNYTMTVSGNANGYSGTLTHQFEVANYIAGKGTSSDPFLISSTDDWNTLAASVAGGISYSDKYVKLTKDITVSTMVGVANSFPFSGTFDGDNHTITANIVSTATGDDVNIQGVAPFHYINGAKIKNLTVAGTITSASKYAAGLVGWSTNYPHINDCVVTATITTSADYAGGFVGNIYANESSTNTYFENCVFAGTIINTSSDADRRAGGFFGYGSGDSYFTNCLENGTYTNLTMMNPRGAQNTYYNNIVTSLCYFNKIGKVGNYITDNYGCHQVKNTIPTEDMYLKKTIHGYNFYQPVLVSDMYDTYAYNNGEEISLGYALEMNTTKLTKGTDYEVAVSPAAPAAIGNYTITFSAKTDNAAGYAGSTVRSFRVIEGESLDGYVFAKDGDVYLINDESDLKRLAAYVNSKTSHTAEGKTFKLTADITMTAAHTPIGGLLFGYDHWFKGTIDGNNKTITNLFSDNLTIYQGLIGDASNAVIKDLTLANCNINGGGNYTGGIAAYASYTTIQNCHVSGTITGKKNVGGIVGYASGNNIITSCENTAAISGDGDNHGGIVGCDESSSNKYSLCLNTGTVAGTNHVGGIAGYYYSNSFTNCYYASPCTVKALNGWDHSGYAERGYIITAGDHISSIVTAEESTITSFFSGAKYYKKGDWTLTLTPDLTNSTFIKYNCEGGTLTNLTTVDGTHKLTITDQDVTISAIVSSNSGVDMSTVEIAAIPDQRWKGSDPVIPALTVTNGTTPLILGTDYIIEAANNAAVGEATLTLTGINGYKGTKNVIFNIIDLPLVDPTQANSAENPYKIETEEDLKQLAIIVNTGGRQNGFYKQMKDITLTEEHTAIGTSSKTFIGTYNGDNKTISGLVINKPDAEYQGLFGYLGDANAIIQKIVIVNCDITGGNYTGGIAGYMSSSSSMIQDCSVSGAIKVADGKSKDYIGGVLGYMNYGTVDNCVNTASVTGNGKCHGGVVGIVTSSTYLKNSFNAGVVEGTSYVGSITGSNNGYLTNNYHTVSTTGGVGAKNVITGTDQTGAEVVVKISAADGVTLTLPAKPTREWNLENLYKSGTVVTLNYEVPEGKFFDRYTVNSGEISNAGVINGEHTLTGFSEDVVITGTYANEIINLATAGAMIEDIDNLTYNGSVQHPAPVVTLATETLEENANYTVSYEEGCTNVGTYTVTVTGTGRYDGIITKTFKIDPYNVSGCDITVSDKAYTGNAIEVTPTVKRGSTTLTQGDEKDYTFVTSPATVQNAGQYTLTITGHGNYTGTKDATFNIYYVKPTELVNTAVTATTATLTWKENSVATQWTVEYGTDNTFATSETVTVDAVPATLDGLTAETTYYARVKAVYGVGKESDWSSVCIVEPTTKLMVGSGTATSTTLPHHSNWRYALTQQIYTAAEIGHSGTILNIDFYDAGSYDMIRKYDVYMVNTDKSSFDSQSDWINVTDAEVVKVFSGNVNYKKGQWSTITLDTPFDYDNSKNLAIIIDDNTNGYPGTTSFRAFSASNQAIEVHSDDTNFDPTNPTAYTGKRQSSKNQLRIRMAEKINMNAHGIMTYASNNALDFKNSAASDDLKAYAVTDCNNGTLTLSKVNEVPATEGLLLKGTANTEFYVNIVASANGITNNHLVGVLKADSIVGQTDGDKTNFVLANGNHGINWYGLKSAGAIGDHKAYLQLTTSEISGARAFTWIYDDGTETTGISNVANSQEPNANSVYDLQGRHIAQPTKKGLYIVNGRKTVVK